ncbi:RNA polymerase sigma-70 factor [Kordia sp.]|uniref:RNA polymerase sigma factor n=1 Tax=Kordia sp. TaxID=1965332 RepID=UPI0025BD172C|nr:RNA polymerase sigma-70 factor [Kordia sp.]MCH2193609.1 RNA polymerase sigma-70 factor [Kordia sp.]
MTDFELLNELKEGKENAFKILFSEYYQWLCNYVFKLSGDYQLSEDLVQDVISKLWENRKRIEVTTSIKNYLFKACHNQFLQHVRKEKTKSDFLDSLRWNVLYETYSTENDEAYQTKLNHLNTLINQLPPRCKEVFIKAKFERKKYKEIADDLNISIKTVEAQMSKALSFLKEKNNLRNSNSGI